MGKFHVNKTTGRVALCRAQKRCPFGDLEQDHYASRQEALEVYEAMMATSVLPRPVVHEELKLMDANDLAHGFLSMASAEGLDAEELSDTLEFASLLHAGQKRQNRGHHDTTPYIEHPLRAAYRLLKLGVRDPSVIKAALLHDTIEDCSQVFVKNIQGRAEELSEDEAREELANFISQRYGEDTTSIILSVTNKYRPKSVSASMTQEEKNVEYKDHLVKEIVDNPRALLVKYSDFMDNAGGLHHNDIPGREIRIRNMASKYQPCVPVFIQEFEKHNPYVDDAARAIAIANMHKVHSRLGKLREKYAHL